MLLQLYEKFQNWSSKGSIWLYSDPHFEDNDCKIMSEDWPSPQEQIDIINSKVFKNDTLILLGDIGNPYWIKKLRAGYKILITGNHDQGVTNYKKKEFHLVYDEKDWGDNEKILRKSLRKKYPDCDIYIYKSYEFHAPFVRYNITIDNRMFDEVYDGPLFISPKICLSHEPLNLGFGLNIHGHKHDLSGGNYDTSHFNVCSNTIDYTPIRLDKIIKEGYLKKVDDIHRVAIDKATSRN